VQKVKNVRLLIFDLEKVKKMDSGKEMIYITSSAINSAEIWPVSRSVPLIPWERPRSSILKEYGLQRWSWYGGEKILDLTGTRTPTPPPSSP
jgi:hypothetical protein